MLRRSCLTGVDIAFSTLAVMAVWARNPEALRCTLCSLASTFFVHGAFLVWLSADIAASGSTLAEIHDAPRMAVLETLLPYVAALVWRGYGLVILHAYQRWMLGLVGETTTLIAAP